MDLLSRLPSIYDASLSRDNWTVALDQIDAVYGAKGVLIYASDNRGIDQSVEAFNNFYVGYEKEIAEYLENFGHFDATSIPSVFAQKLYGIARDSDIWPEFDFESSSKRQDIEFIQRVFGIRRRLGINISPNLAWNCALVLQWDKSEVVIDEKRLAEGSWVLPHISKAFEVNRFYSQLMENYNAVLSVLDRVSIAVCVVTETGHVPVSNKNARRIFQQQDGISVDRSGVIATHNQDHYLQLCGYISKIAHTAKGENDCVEYIVSIPKRSSAESFLVEVSPLRDSAGEYEKYFTGCLLTIIDPENPPELNTQPFSKLFGLTPAEASVVDHLICGATIDEIAETRNVQFNTVKNQCKMIYSKSGAKNRGSLIGKIASLSPPIDKSG